MVRQISFAILVLAWVGLYPAAYADFRIVPGMTMRTNSPACLAKYQEVYNLAGAYFNGVPAISTLKRVDVLSGGLAFDNATATPVIGKQRTQLYSVSSSYGSVPTGNVDGYMELQNGYDSRFEVGTWSNVRIKLSDGGVLRLNASHDSCGLNEKSSNSYIDYNSSVNMGDLGQANLYFSVYFGSSSGGSSVCGSTARKISDIIGDSKAINLGNGEPRLMASGTEIPYSEIDTSAKRSAKALTLAQSGIILWSGFYTVVAGSVGCYANFYDPALNELPSDSDEEKRRKRNLNVLGQFVRHRQCWLEINSFIDRILSSGVLKSTTFATACSKAK
jgi:hypothetical protein